MDRFFPYVPELLSDHGIFYLVTIKENDMGIILFILSFALKTVVCSLSLIVFQFVVSSYIPNCTYLPISVNNLLSTSGGALNNTRCVSYVLVFSSFTRKRNVTSCSIKKPNMGVTKN